MAAEIDYLPIATGAGANVQAQAAYAGSVSQTQGVGAGTADETVANKMWRQSSMMAAAIALMVSNALGGADVLDDGNLVGLAQLISQAIETIAQNEGLTLAEVDAAILTQANLAAGDASTKVANAAFVQASIAAALAAIPPPRQLFGNTVVQTGNRAFGLQYMNPGNLPMFVTGAANIAGGGDTTLSAVVNGNEVYASTSTGTQGGEALGFAIMVPGGQSYQINCAKPVRTWSECS